jgi:Cof subfamily protein (haloacid dehalogenase superfamily)
MSPAAFAASGGCGVRRVRHISSDVGSACRVRPHLRHVQSSRAAVACAAGPQQHLSSARAPAPALSPHPYPLPSVLFCDVDGTLLNSEHGISSRNVDTMSRVLDSPGTLFIPATGKSRAGAVKSMATLGARMQEMYPGGLPGVYLQGLVVYGMDGNLVHHATLEPSLCVEVLGLAKQYGLSLVAYAGDGDTILYDGERDEYIQSLTAYHEPDPVPGLVGSIEDGVPIYKFLFVSTEKRIVETRGAIEEALGSRVEVTRATEGMLEVLPRGASKGAGVSILLELLGIAPDAAMAIGDGENDVEMLQICGTSVCMSNGVDVARKAATFSTSSNNESGAAEAVDRFIFSRLAPPA